MLSVMPLIFLTLGLLVIAVGAVVAVYFILGLLFVQKLHQCECDRELLQLQTQFLTDDAAILSDTLLKDTAFLERSSPIHGEGLHILVERTGHEPEAIGS